MCSSDLLVEEMQQQRAQFVAGCAKVNNIPADQANRIFDLLEKFAGYGFNKSHAAAYAIVAYQTAYLKANYPVEFLAAMLTNDMGDTDKVAILINEARVLGVEILPPDVNESQVAFAPARAGAAVRFGLAAIKNVGEVAVESILKARQEGGRFHSLANLCERVETRTVNRKVLEALIKCGACDGVGATRASLFANIDRALARASSMAQDRSSGQGSLFGDVFAETATAPSNGAEPLPEWPHSDRLAAEKELLGFYVTGHPFNPFLPLAKKFALTDIAGLNQLQPRSMTRVAALVSAVQPGISKKNNKPYIMATLEDLDSTVQLLCINENYDKYRELLVVGNALLVTTEVNKSEDKAKLFPQEIMRIEEAPRRYTKQVHLRLRAAQTTPDLLVKIRELVTAHAGKCPLFLCFIQPGGETIFIETSERFHVQPSLELQQAVEALLGPDAFYAKADLALPERAPRRWERKNDSGES